MWFIRIAGRIQRPWARCVRPRVQRSIRRRVRKRCWLRDLLRLLIGVIAGNGLRIRISERRTEACPCDLIWGLPGVKESIGCSLIKISFVYFLIDFNYQLNKIVRSGRWHHADLILSNRLRSLNGSHLSPHLSHSAYITNRSSAYVVQKAKHVSRPPRLNPANPSGSKSSLPPLTNNYLISRSPKPSRKILKISPCFWILRIRNRRSSDLVEPSPRLV